MALSGRLRQKLFGVPLREVSPLRRGFRVEEGAVCDRLEQIGRTFLQGYDAALGCPEAGLLASRLDSIENELRGFAYEGAAMGLGLVDGMSLFRKNRLNQFIAGPGDRHAYMVHIGIGWALARLQRSVDGALKRLDPLLGWLAVDGYGFHHGYFDWPQMVVKQRIPRGLTGYARRAFDQGLGRSLWFVEGADAGRVTKTITTFPAHRRADLWSGVGLAAAYAGSIDLPGLEMLREGAAAHRPHLAQGVAFAAQARRRAGNPAPHTALACEVICGLSPAEAAEITDQALGDLPAGNEEPAYEIWRRRIQERFRDSGGRP